MPMFFSILIALIGLIPIGIVFLLGLTIPRNGHRKDWNPVNRVLLRMKWYFRSKKMGKKGVILRELFDWAIHFVMCAGVGLAGQVVLQFDMPLCLAILGRLMWFVGIFFGMSSVVYYLHIGYKGYQREADA